MYRQVFVVALSKEGPIRRDQEESTRLFAAVDSKLSKLTQTSELVNDETLWCTLKIIIEYEALFDFGEGFRRRRKVKRKVNERSFERRESERLTGWLRRKSVGVGRFSCGAAALSSCEERR